MHRKSLYTAIIAVAAGATLAACGGSINPDTSTSAAPTSSAGSSSAMPTETLKIGFVSPQTGPLAGFGEADTFVVAEMTEFFNQNPIVAGGTSYSVEIIVKDAQSDSARAAEVAADLINNDQVDIVMAAGTPDIVNPVADTCEALSTPCITDNAPWQPYYIGRQKDPADPATWKPFKWTYHFFWGLEDVSAVFQDIWSQVDTNKKVGGLFPNDPDGQAWSGNFPALVKDNGYTINNPGLYPNGTQDFSAQISAFKADNDEIVMGVPIPPDFTTFWKQAKQQGYNPKVATIGKALLFPSSVEALGDLGNNLSTEIWWSPAWPYTSSLTGQSAKELADQYETTTGKQWTQPIGYVEALFEVAQAAVVAAGGKDKEAIVKALSTLSVDTIVGKVNWAGGNPQGPGGPIPNVAKTPLVGGQWRLVEGGKYPYELVVTSNTLDPSIPAASKVEPLS